MCKNKILTTILALSMLFVGTFSFSSNISAEEKMGSDWQVVDQKYPNGDFNYSDDLSVRVKKSAQGTDIRNKFRMHLNVETKMSWEEVLGLSSIKFTNNASYLPQYHLPNYPSGGGNSWSTPTKNGNNTKPIYISFYYNNRGTKVHVSNNTFYVSTNKVPNSSYAFGNPFIKIDGTYVPNSKERDPYFGAFSGGGKFPIDTNSLSNPLEVDISSIFSKYDFLLTTPKVTSLSDEMGDYIEYNGNLSSNHSESLNKITTSKSQTGNQKINWDMSNIQLKPIDGDYVNGVFIPTGVEEYIDKDGKIAYYRKDAYTLEYDFTLNTSKEGFLYNKVYDCNTMASVTYDLNKETNKNVDFLVPKVKDELPPEYYDELIELDKTSKKIEDEFNKFKIKLDVDVKAAGNVQLSEPADIVLLFDASGSMAGEPMNIAKEAAKNFVDKSSTANVGNRFAVASFGYYAKSNSDNFTENVSEIKNTIVNLNANTQNGKNGTNIQAGIHEAKKLLDSRNAAEKKTKGIIILLSDGAPTGMYNVKTTEFIPKEPIGALQTSAYDKSLNYPYDWVYPEIDWDSDPNRGGQSVPTQEFWQNKGANNVIVDGVQLAEGEALFAKKAGYSIYTIGYNLQQEFPTSLTKEQIKKMLRQIASPNTDSENYVYEASTLNIDEVFNQISNTVVQGTTHIIKNGVVTDPMSDFVNLLDVVDGTYKYDDPSIRGKLIFEVGEVTVKTHNGKQTITWNIGNIKDDEHLSLEYFVELKEPYINGMDHDANDRTTLSYKNYVDENKIKDFPIPTVKEQLLSLVISKKVINADANVVDDSNKQFIVKIEGRDIHDPNKLIYKSDVLIKDGEEIKLTELPVGNYTVSETVVMEYQLINIEVVDGKDVSNVTDKKFVGVSLPSGNGAQEAKVTFTNKFSHQGYFKNDDEVANVFKGTISREKAMKNGTRINVMY